MAERQQPFINELNKEIVITHTPTSARLLKLGRTGVDAFTLYHFYCYCAAWQLTNKVRATDSFAMKGLHWGRDRFRNAKNLLLKEKLIEPVKRRNKNGKIVGHYVYIHFLNGFTTGGQNPHSGFGHRVENGTTNAYDKKISALDKKDSVATEVATIYPSFLDRFLKSKQRHLQIIGIWAREKGLQIPNEEVFKSVRQRNLRAARLLVGYEDEDIVETIRILERTDYLSKFTLETVGKYIDEVVAQKKKRGPKIVRYEEVIKPNGSKVMRAVYEENEKT